VTGRRTAAYAAVLAAVLAACSPSAPAPRATAGSAARDATAVGVAVYGDRAYPVAAARSDAARIMAYVKGTLHVRAVQVTWNLWQPDARSGAIGATAISMTPDDVLAVTQAAQADGLAVEYRVLMRVGNWKWGGFASPSDPAAWFANLYAAELPYLRVAAGEHVGEFIVGTELAAVNTSPVWESFLSKVGSAYPGTVSYAWLGGQLLDARQRHLLPLGEYGITAYPDARLPATATVAQLTARWESFLGQAPGWLLSSTAIDEVGIPAIAGGYDEPWNWTGLTGPLDEAVQARWYTAACTAAVRDRMRAIYFWNINLGQDPASPAFPDPVHFIGKTGAQAITACAEAAEGESG
jgi:hypothetical protein